jgi:predicted MFS family arabinose efflux permease
MLATSVVNVVLNLLLAPHAAWALLPVAVFSFGWALMVPAVTLLALDQLPDRRGMASSVQACVGSLANAAGGRRGGAFGDAFHAGAGPHFAGHAGRGRGGLGLGQAALEPVAGLRGQVGGLRRR